MENNNGSMARIDSLFRGDRIQDAHGDIGTIIYEDSSLVYVEFDDGSRHLYKPTSEVTRLDPLARPAVLGGSDGGCPPLLGSC